MFKKGSSAGRKEMKALVGLGGGRCHGREAYRLGAIPRKSACGAHACRPAPLPSTPLTPWSGVLVLGRHGKALTAMHGVPRSAPARFHTAPPAPSDCYRPAPPSPFAAGWQGRQPL